MTPNALQRLRLARSRRGGAAVLVLAALLALALPPTARAQTSSECAGATYALMGKQQRLFRAVLYGEREPEKQRVGSVLFDKDGAAWRKTDENTWKSLAKGYQGTTWTDTGMRDNWEKDEVCDDEDEDIAATCVIKPRRGIYETRKALTSELMPEILLSVRAFQCRLQAICAAADLTHNVGDTEPDVVQPYGCLEMTVPAIPACRGEINRTDYGFGACQQAIAAVLRHEITGLELTVSHDSYRPYLQLAGMFEDFSDTFAKMILKPVFAATKAMLGFDKIPCFLSQCDK